MTFNKPHYSMHRLQFWPPKRLLAIILSFLYITAYWLFLLYLLFYLSSCKPPQASNTIYTLTNTEQHVATYHYTVVVFASNTQPIQRTVLQKEAFTYYYVQLNEGLWQVAIKQKIPTAKIQAWIERVAKLNKINKKDGKGNYIIFTDTVLTLPKSL